MLFYYDPSSSLVFCSFFMLFLNFFSSYHIMPIGDTVGMIFLEIEVEVAGLLSRISIEQSFSNFSSVTLPNETRSYWYFLL